MTGRPRPARVHYYIDADLLGVAKILVQLRGDVTYPGDPGGPVKGGRVRPPCTITDPATLDAVRIPETARQEWLIITRDRRIQEHRAEIEAVSSSGARMVNLAADDATDRFAQMEVIMCQWRHISALLDEKRPLHLRGHQDLHARTRPLATPKKTAKWRHAHQGPPCRLSLASTTVGRRDDGTQIVRFWAVIASRWWHVVFGSGYGRG